MIPLPQAKDKTYFVLGLGKSGRASAAALTRSGANVLAWDDNEHTRTKALAMGYVLSNPMRMEWKGITALVMSPGIPLTHPAPHPAAALARAAGVPIISDMDLLFTTCPAATYIGITGTNGKSTTTALIAHILANSGRKVQMGGNIGTPALALEPLDAEGFYVLELSSYQLDLLHSNPLSIAVLLNITPDHFDRHGGLAGYIEAKMKIARTSEPQTLILGTDEPETISAFEQLKPRTTLTIQEVSSKHDVAQGLRLKEHKLYMTNGDEPLDLKDYAALPGQHNAQNAAAAYAVCKTLNLARTQIEEGMASFPGLAHRQQLVAESDGVRFINDSKATNADAASKALACYESIYWIIGGRPKAGGLDGLEALMGSVVHAFLIGQSSEAFALWCKAKNVPFTSCGTLDVATEQAAAMAWEDKRKGAVVLLSPACASWDQFSSFEERGNHFEALVRALPQRK